MVTFYWFVRDEVIDFLTSDEKVRVVCHNVMPVVCFAVIPDLG